MAEAADDSLNLQRPRRRRRWLRRLTAAAIVAAAGYAALPLWLPTGWLRARLEGLLTKELGLPVSLGAMTISWRGGVEIDGLQIRRPPGFGEGFLLTIGRVVCPFAPVGSVVGGKLEFLSLESPQLWIVLSPAGDVNLADLQTRSRRVLTHDLRMSDCRVHFENQQSGQTALVVIDELSLTLDERSGRARWEFRKAQARAGRDAPAAPVQDEGSFRGSAEMFVPTLNPNVPLDGNIVLSWDRLNLESLGLTSLGEWPVSRIAGRSQGALSLDISRDLEIRWRFKGQVADLTVGSRSGREIPLGSLGIDTEGEWDPTADEWNVYRWSLSGPSAEVLGRLELAPRGPVSISLHAWGWIDAGAAAARLDPASPGQTSGPVKFNAEWSRSQSEDRAELSVDGAEAAIRWPQRANLPAGLSKSLRLELRRSRRRGDLDVHVADMRIGPVSGGLRAGLSEPPAIGLAADADAWVTWAISGHTALEARLEISDAQALAEHWPAADRVLGPLGWRGGGQAEFRLRPGDEELEAWGRLQLPAASAVETPWLSKPWGQSGGVEIRARLPRNRPGNVESLVVMAEIGAARCEIGGPNAIISGSLESSPASRAPLARIHASAGLRLVRTDEWMQRCPLLRDRLDQVHLIGECEADLMADVEWRAGRDEPADWSVAAAGRLDGRDIEASFAGRGGGNVFAKPAGQSALAAIRYQAGRRGGRFSQEAGFTSQSAGLAADGYWRTDSAGEQDSLRINLALSDVEAAGRSWPALASRLDRHRPSGAAEAELMIDRRGRQLDLVWSSRMTDLSWDWPGPPAWSKPAGVECVVSGQARIDLAAKGDGSTNVRVPQVELRLAGSRAEIVDAHVELPIGGDLGQALAGLGAACGFSCDVRLEPGLRRLSPSLAGWLDGRQMVGRAGLTGRITGRGSTWGVQGTVDLSDLGWRTPIAMWPGRPDDPVSFRKAAGMTATGEIEGRIAWDADGANVWCLLDRAELQFGTGRIEASGDLAIERRAGSPTLGDSAVRIEVDLPDLAETRTTVSGGLIPQLEGGLRLTGRLGRAGGGWRLGESSATMQYVTGQVQDRKVVIDGTIEISDRSVRFPLLSLEVGPSDLTLSGAIAGLDAGRPDGELLLHSRMLDLDDLRGWMGRVGPTYLPVDLADEASPSGQSAPDQRLALLRAARVRGSLDVGGLRASIPEMNEDYNLDRLLCDFAVKDGRTDLSFVSAMSGGVAEGKCALVLDPRQSYFDLDLSAHDLRPTDDVQRWIGNWFPGMTVTGTVDKRQKTRTLLGGPADRRWPEGESELVVHGGYVVGKSAPDWLVRVVPQMRKTQYNFSWMRNRSRMMIDGRQYNDLVFVGRPINVYMNGESTADGRTDYEVGWIGPFAAMESPYWHERGVGRIPLFRSTARIRDRQFENQVITYVPIYETLFRVVGKTLAVPYYGARALIEGTEPASRPAPPETREQK